MASSTGSIHPYGYQVAGHFTHDHEPTIMQTSDGDIVKPLAQDERGSRELEFYKCAELARGSSVLPALAGWAQSPSVGSVIRVTDGHTAAVEVLQRVVAYIPRCFGLKALHCGTGVVLENLCQGYTRPFVCDIKLGFTTTYAWASAKYNNKNSKKDGISTQASLGFKISGMCKWSGNDKVLLGKSECSAASANVQAFLVSFAENAMTPGNVWTPVTRVLADLSEWVRGQPGPAWHLKSVSLLVIYEGTASDTESLRVRCGLVDFAHSFYVAEGPDSDMLKALDSLTGVLACVTGH